MQAAKNRARCVRFFRKCLEFLGDSDHLVCFRNRVIHILPTLFVMGFQLYLVEMTAFLIIFLLHRRCEQLLMNNLRG